MEDLDNVGTKMPFHQSGDFSWMTQIVMEQRFYYVSKWNGATGVPTDFVGSPIETFCIQGCVTAKGRNSAFRMTLIRSFSSFFKADCFPLNVSLAA